MSESKGFNFFVTKDLNNLRELIEDNNEESIRIMECERGFLTTFSDSYFSFDSPEKAEHRGSRYRRNHTYIFADRRSIELFDLSGVRLDSDRLYYGYIKGEKLIVERLESYSFYGSYQDFRGFEIEGLDKLEIDINEVKNFKWNNFVKYNERGL